MNDSIGAGVTVNTVSRNTEIGRAERFVETIKRTHRFVSETKEWHVCEDGVWRKTDEKQVLQQAFLFIKQDAQRIAGMDDDRDREEAIVDYRRYANRSGVSNFTALASVRLLAQLDEFDTDDNALSVNEGWVDLRTNKRHGIDASKMFSLSCAARYSPFDGAELWRRTVNEVFNGDKGLIEYLQKAAGYSLLGDNREQVMFICHGAGANGKSLLLETIREVLGTYGQTVPVTALMSGKSNSGGANPEIARLRGVRFALASETEKGQRWSANRIKQLTGGDTVAARALYKDVSEFKSKATIWVACNHKPEVDAADTAMWRRMRLIPFLRVFKPEEQDANLSVKLAEERDGILAWMLQGLAMYREQGLTEPDAVVKATAKYRDEMDSVKRFIETQAEFVSDGRTPLSRMKEAYQNWRRDEGLRPLAASQFNASLEEHGCEQKKSGNHRYWSGIRLIDRLEDDMRACGQI